MDKGEKEELSLRLQPYRKAVVWGYSVMMWKNPIILFLLAGCVNGLLIFAYVTEAGLFALVSLIILAIYSVIVAEDKFGFVSLVCGTSSSSSENEEDDFNKACLLLSGFKSYVRLVLEYLLGSRFPSGVVKIGYVSVVWITVAFVFSIVGKFFFFLVLVNVCLLGPGLALNPEARANLQKKFESGTGDKPKTE